MSHIIVGLSGGVDSTISAYLLKQAGHQVEAVFMKNWEDEHCPSTEDIEIAYRISEQLDIPLTIVNFSESYWQQVFSIFLDEFRKGRTPNPDILCNKEIKFNVFLDYAKKQGADCIATGHYAGIKQNDDHAAYLYKAFDKNKDQSYFLYSLNQDQLKKALFPLADWCKVKVREQAKLLRLVNHDKKDSTGICFIGERHFKQFLNDYIPMQKGIIKTEDGQTIGEHDGVFFYTIGQRSGLHIGGRKESKPLPWYVAQKIVDENILIVVQGEHPLLYRSQLIASSVHWINPPKAFPLHIAAKTRYRQEDQACVVKKLDENTCEVHFAQPQRAITPGQSIVFYQDDICLGGGIIEEERFGLLAS